MKTISQHRITGLVKGPLHPNTYFVFGSNLQGRHGKGAAKTAKVYYGAKNGVGEGLTGQCYALPTVDMAKGYRTMKPREIKKYVDNFIQCAIDNPDKTFLVSAVGCGLAGNTASGIAPLFEKCVEMENVTLPYEFWKELGYEREQ
jgi:hypothetical protein